MREIKFRGKAKSGKTALDANDIPNFSGWVFGNLILSGRTVAIAGGIAEMDDEYIAHEWWAAVDPETVGQYTGLKDKNGRRIYEGDVAECFSFGLTTVEFRNGSFGLYSKRQGFFPFHDLLGRPKVIGNIFENKDLLD